MPAYAHVGVHMKHRRKSSVSSIEDWTVAGIAKAFAGVPERDEQASDREEEYQDGYKDDESDVSAEPAWRPGDSESELSADPFSSSMSKAKSEAARKREDVRNQLNLSKLHALTGIPPPLPLLFPPSLLSALLSRFSTHHTH